MKRFASILHAAVPFPQAQKKGRDRALPFFLGLFGIWERKKKEK